MDDLLSSNPPHNTLNSDQKTTPLGKKAYKAPTFQMLRTQNTQGSKNASVGEFGSTGS